MPKSRRRSRLSTQIGPYAMLPLWLVESCADGAALRLYAYLGAKYGGLNAIFPTRQTLADALGVSPASVKRATEALRAAGALRTTTRHRPSDGAVLGLDYELIQTIEDSQKVKNDLLEGVSHKVISDRAKRSNLVRRRPAQLSLSDPDRSEADKTALRGKQSPEPDPPQPGTVFTGGYIRPPKTKRDPHAGHVFCGDWIHVSAEKHAEYEQRVKLAGFDLGDVDLAAFYRRADEELGATATTEHPNFWLAKRFSEELKATAEATA